MSYTVNDVVAYLDAQGIAVSPCTILPSFFDPKNEIAGKALAWLPFSKQV